MATKHINFAAKFLAVAAFFLPLQSYAALSQSLPDRTAASTPNFCTNLGSFSAQVNSRLALAGGNLDEKQKQRQENVDAREKNRQQDLTKLRTEGDADRQAIYKQLTDKAATEAQKQAIIAFQNTMEAAVTARRQAVDAAITAYWTGVKQLLDGRQAQVSSARQALATALSAALTAAQSACDGGTAPATVRSQFAAAVKAANAKFAADKQSIDKIGVQIKALVQTRNQAFKKAFDDFHATAEQARKTLKAAFAASPSPTPTPSQ